ncbi:LAFE_0F13212g1_1 [Lachancea fermentati]|uniref:LAFE_0F13212g1_1 n=1 Tax=Lachancea fermentati TaxID=4955 RepID=A0A1G4MFT2_LACFM|nr:LAFE_0F13212g1_1 [Lachancea fermentati]
MRQTLRCRLSACRYVFKAHSEPPILWFYASDLPNKKPFEPNYNRGNREPKKFIPFSKNDSKRLERFYQLMKSKDGESPSFKSIPVNEDYLFEVDLNRKEVKPTYWEGPVYEVRRGLWFNSDHMPLRDELANELEHYFQTMQAKKSNHKGIEESPNQHAGHRDVFKLSPEHKEGKLVLFTDEKTAFLLPELYGGRLQLNWLRSNLAQAVQFGAAKVTRGHSTEGSITDIARKNIEKEVQDTTKSLGKITDLISWELFGFMSGINPLASSQADDNSEVMKREMETDYKGEDDTEKEVKSNHRPIDHLVFCVHGIGQNLGKKYQYVNFAHTVNLLRANMKKLYSESDKLKNFNKDNNFDDWEHNCRTQVIPITWRHKIGFNTDDADINTEDPSLPTLNDLTLDGVKPLRKVLGDVVLDLLLYGEYHYKYKIRMEVVKQLNDLYNLYCSRNPDFDGQVHIIGHSLGSLIVFDILSNPNRYPLDFEVQSYFSIGSPVGVFKLIQKTKIAPYNGKDKSEAVDKPRCQNFYNIFHVCDPVAYRVEPLVDRNMSSFQPAYVPHWTNSDLAAKVFELGGALMSSESKGESANVGSLTARQVSLLTQLNYAGRIDYSFTPNFLEVDLISAIRAHVSYFEEMDMAGFVLKELLSKHHRANGKLLARKGGSVKNDR